MFLDLSASEGIPLMKQDINSTSDGHWRRALRRAQATANHDFCPWANRYVYWLKQPIGWFVIAAAASLLIGLTFAPQGIVMFAAIMVFMLMGVLWPWIEMRGLACRLRFVKARLREGESVQIRLDIVNRWPWPVRGLAVERGFFAEARGDDNATAVALARVPGWSRSSYYWSFQPPRRGVYPAKRPVLATGFPFGIWHARREIEVIGELIVWPQTIRLDSVPPVSGQDFTVAGMLSNHTGNEERRARCSSLSTGGFAAKGPLGPDGKARSIDRLRTTGHGSANGASDHRHADGIPPWQRDAGFVGMGHPHRCHFVSAIPRP